MSDQILLRPSERLALIEQGIEPPGATDYRQPMIEIGKRMVEDALKAIPEGKRGALVAISDRHGSRVHLAAKMGDTWKVAASAGVAWDGKMSFGVGVVGAW